MFLHELLVALNEGKKIKRLSWDKNQYMLKAKAVSAFELDDQECKTIGVPNKTVAEPDENCLLLVTGQVVKIGYELNGEDKMAQDWELSK